MPVPPSHHRATDQSNVYGSHFGGNHLDYSQRAFGEELINASRSRSRRPDGVSPISYPPY